jgi:hypothetical protein
VATDGLRNAGFGDHHVTAEKTRDIIWHFLITIKDYSEHQPREKGMVSSVALREMACMQRGYKTWPPGPASQKWSDFAPVVPNKRDEKATGYQPI